MELVNNEKTLYAAFLCIGYGVICGAIFTLVSHLFSRQLRHPLARAIVDISLYFLSSVGLFLLSLSLTDGRPRFWIFGGTAAGFFCWKRLLEIPICRGCFLLSRPIFAIGKVVKNTIGRLFDLVGVKLQKKVKKSEIFFKNLLKFKRGLLYNKRK